MYVLLELIFGLEKRETKELNAFMEQPGTTIESSDVAGLQRICFRGSDTGLNLTAKKELTWAMQEECIPSKGPGQCQVPEVRTCLARVQNHDNKCG